MKSYKVTKATKVIKATKVNKVTKAIKATKVNKVTKIITAPKAAKVIIIPKVITVLKAFEHSKYFWCEVALFSDRE